MAKRRINSVVSTSAGRLFDAVSAILGVRLCSTFEGEASTTLEFRAEAYEEETSAEELKREIVSAIEEDGGLAKLTLSEDKKCFLLPTDRIVKYMVEKKLAGERTEKLAYLFHALLAGQIAAGCQRAAKDTGLPAVALSGGVFQNQLLLRLCEEQLEMEGLSVIRHRLLPPNDGGLALGQAVAAMAALNRK